MRPEIAVCPVCRANDVARERSRRAAEAAFEDARELGGMVHRSFLTERYGARGFRARIRSDEKVLMDVARSQFDADPEFRRLWLAVKQGPPSLADLPWLRLWKNG
jgi:hypothetical protein